MRLIYPLRRMSVRSTAASGSTVYESSRAVQEYLQMHYGKARHVLPYAFGPSEALDFVVRCADICRYFTTSKHRVLDVGCAVGGASFALARSFEHVIGVDFSHSFVETARKMQLEGSMPYTAQRCGEVFTHETAEVGPDIDRSRVAFVQGDACELDPSLGNFDCVLASNLLCRLPRPRQFLASMPSFISAGGTLVLVSPYSWLEEYTAKHEWMGGTDAAPDSFAEVRAALEPEFELVHREDMPFLIREHARKFQWGVSDCTVWRKL